MKLIEIKNLFDFEKGTLQSSKNTKGKFNFITASQDWKTHNSYDYDIEALIFAMAASGSLGRTHYVNGKFISSDLCFVITPKKDYKDKIDLKFYHNVFNILKKDIVKETATGTSKLAINRTNFGKYKIPFFDISHQEVFQKKINFLLPNQDKLQYEFNLQKETVKKLKASILQDAIQGKLSVQNENEFSNDLIQDIKDKKEQLIKDKKIKKEKALSLINKYEILFDIPKNWTWVRLNDIAEIGTGATPLTGNPQYYNGDIYWITSSNTGDDCIVNSNKKITQKALDETNCKLYPIGSLVIALYGQGKTRGQISELHIESATNQACAVMVFKNLNTEIKDYIKYFFKYK